VLAPTGSESAAFDRYAIDTLGVPQPVLMENAGRTAAQVLARLFEVGPVVGLVGAGNNGGDALVLLRSLAAWGWPVQGILVADRSDGDDLLHGWNVPLIRDTDLLGEDGAWSSLMESGTVLVDGILGTGVRGAPRKRQARAIRALNAASRPVLAIDIPSGVDGDTGATPGEAVRADVTVAFGAPKLGTLLHPGRGLTGRLVAVEIGFPPTTAGTAAAEVMTPAGAQALLPVRDADTHKNAVGRVVVVAGASGMAGAAVMAARAAFRAGAGLVQVASSPANREIVQVAVPEAIFVDADDPQALEAALADASALAVGPGLGTASWGRKLLERTLESPSAPLVADADALNLLAEGRAGGLGGASARRPVLVTPHPGEMSRLTGRPVSDIGADRIGFATAVAEEHGCSVLLKGAPSVVASPGQRVLVDALGSSDLAVAGMGDVLTGVCVGLLAQGLGPREAGAVGLYLTGRAAALAGRGPALTPPDVVRWLPEALRERGEGESELHLVSVIFDHDPAR
jgi:NAD(P)H-hydrate epimerase